MALYRSKLGPVGGGNENGISEGGVVVDLDPLSAFALMDGGAAEDLGTTTNSGGASSNNAGTKPVPLSGDTVTPVGKDHEPALGRRDSRGAESKMSDLGRWRVSDLGGAVQSQQPRTTLVSPLETTSPPTTLQYSSSRSSSSVQHAGGPAHAASPARVNPPRLPPLSLTSPSLPRQLEALGDAPSFPAMKTSGLKSVSSPTFEDGPGQEATSEKIDPLEILRAEGIECLTGELLLVKLQNASVEALHGNMVPGVLIMTTYKLVLIPHRQVVRGMTPHGAYSGADERYFPFGHLPKEYLQVPMTYIDKVERDSERKGTPRVDRYFNLEGAVTIHCKDARRVRVSFGGPEESERAMKMLHQLAFPGQQMEHLFAFSHYTLRSGLPDPGWHIFDPWKELDRMGVLKPRRNSGSPWRTTDLNLKYRLCASYPNVLVVPSSVTNSEVEASAQFRSEQRLPVLCWGRQSDSASIWRSSQPKIGMSRATCAEDEHLLGRVAAESPSRILPIVDCRPRSNATANFATGYGYESYADCPLEFSGIGNIHVMRESLAKLESLCLGNTAKDNDWTAIVEDTRWLSHVRTVLASAWTVAFKVHTKRTPVLVHCSHGWDRTSQVCALAQMLLDPFYRTVDGFQVLIEKDWLAFGHPFHLRHAYGLPRGVTSGKEDQRSPIFLQFLDCTWQLVMQLPSFFEFNPRYLLCIAEHIQSCRFGTFLCNTDKARKEAKLNQRCASLWTFLELHRASFLSKLYHSDTQEVLLPPLSTILRHVRLWSDYFLRWSPAPSFTPLPLPLRGSDVFSKESCDDGCDVESNRIKLKVRFGASHIACPTCHDCWTDPEFEYDNSMRVAVQQPGDSPTEPNSNSTTLPLSRCEFDETERWVTLYGREADRWRRKALGDGNSDAQRSRGGGVAGVAGGGHRWTDSIGARPGSEQADSEDLAIALKEIARLKAALAEKEELVSVLLSAGTPDRPPSSAATYSETAQPKAMADLRTDSDEELSVTAQKTHNSGNSSGTNDMSGGTNDTGRSTSGDRGASVATTAADREAAPGEADGSDDWLLDDRPRGYSSLAESREVRRSSLNNMNLEDDRARCMSGAAADVLYDVGDEGLGEEDLEADDGDLSRSNSSWKWEFTGWGGAGSGGKGNSGAAPNGVVLSRKGGTRK